MTTPDHPLSDFSPYIKLDLSRRYTSTTELRAYVVHERVLFMSTTTARYAQHIIKLYLTRRYTSTTELRAYRSSASPSSPRSSQL